MGYYSQVAIGIAPHCVQEVLPVIQEVKPDVAEFTYNWHVFVWKTLNGTRMFRNTGSRKKDLFTTCQFLLFCQNRRGNRRH